MAAACSSGCCSCNWTALWSTTKLSSFLAAAMTLKSANTLVLGQNTLITGVPNSVTEPLMTKGASDRSLSFLKDVASQRFWDWVLDSTSLGENSAQCSEKALGLGLSVMHAMVEDKA